MLSRLGESCARVPQTATAFKKGNADKPAMSDMDLDANAFTSMDSVAASDLSESAADLETMNHGIFEAQAAMATQAGTNSHWQYTTAIHFDAENELDSPVRFNGRFQPGTDKFSA